MDAGGRASLKPSCVGAQRSRAAIKASMDSAAGEQCRLAETGQQGPDTLGADLERGISRQPPAWVASGVARNGPDCIAIRDCGG